MEIEDLLKDGIIDEKIVNILELRKKFNDIRLNMKYLMAITTSKNTINLIKLLDVPRYTGISDTIEVVSNRSEVSKIELGNSGKIQCYLRSRNTSPEIFKLDGEKVLWERHNIYMIKITEEDYNYIDFKNEPLDMKKIIK